jgi:DNA invertase Pin-like site-specific DNA recombinase
MNSFAYVRVSSRAQTDLMQRTAIEATAAARGDTIGMWFAEKMSAKTTARPELLRFLAHGRIRGGTAYCYKIDRLCRSGVADTFAVVEELRRAGVTLICVADNLVIRPDKDDVTSETLVFALGLAARLERTAINDRIASARARVEAAGGRWGRPSRVDRATRERAAQLRAEGKTVREIARTLKIPRATIARHLSQKVAAVGGADRPKDRRDPAAE